MITLYTAATPNGHKVSIVLEELGLAYEARALNLGAHDQKQPWFTAINPNGRIPAIVDHDPNHDPNHDPDHDPRDLVVFESGAIMIYLAEKAGALLPTAEPARAGVMQWLMFQMGGVGPMMGQANVFSRYAPEKIPYAIERYQKESRRLFEVLDDQLQRGPYLAGEYSIADIANYAWVRIHEWSGVDVTGLDALASWLERIGQRPAVIRGLAVPEAAKTGEEVEAMARKIIE